jgi:hypothetical protein
MCYTRSRLVKRSQALRGRNLTRDSQTDGASIKHQASDNQVVRGFSFTDRTPEPCLRKSRGLGQSPVGCRPDSRLYGIAPTGDFPAARFHNASFVICYWLFLIFFGSD